MKYTAVFALTWCTWFGTCLIVFKFYIVKHMVFPTVLNACCLVPWPWVWYMVHRSHSAEYMMSALAWYMVFGTEIVHSILIITTL